MAAAPSRNNNQHKSVVKRTAQGGAQPKLSTMNKIAKNSFKRYRGQGR